MRDIADRADCVSAAVLEPTRGSTLVHGTCLMVQSDWLQKCNKKIDSCTFKMTIARFRSHLSVFI